MKQVANVERRTWDKDAYEKRAKERAERGAEDGSGEDRRARLELLRAKAESEARNEFRAAEDGAAGPEGSNRAYLQHRRAGLSLDDNVGKSTEVQFDAEGKMARGGGYYCEVCEILLRDSAAYLDHINSQRHLSKLGFSMRIQRSTLESVREKLKSLTEERLKKISTPKAPRVSARKEYDNRLHERERERLAQRKAREQEREATRVNKRRAEESEVDDRTGREVSEDDVNMMDAMGFSGFGGGKKK